MPMKLNKNYTWNICPSCNGKKIFYKFTFGENRVQFCSDCDLMGISPQPNDEELSLIRDFPIAVRMDAFLTYKQKDKNIGDMKTPFNVKFLSGGSLSDKVSYYFLLKESVFLKI